MSNVLIAAQKLPTAQSGIRDLLHAVLRLRGARQNIALTRDQLSGVVQPVLLAWGTRDGFGSIDLGRTVARAMRRASLHEIEGAGHIPWVQQPEAVAAAIRPFLARYAVH